MIELHLSQKDIYFDHILNKETLQYNIGTYVVIKGNLNTDLFKVSVNSAQDVFDAFKYQYFSKNSPGLYLKDSVSNLPITELSLTSKKWSDKQIKDWLRGRINEPFDIHNGHLYDFVLIKKQEGEYWFYIGCHHLFSDGYGVPYILLTYIFDKYHALRTGANKEFNYPSYLQLIEKSNNYINSDSYELDKNYWNDRFKISQEPILKDRSKANSFRTKSIKLLFTVEEQEKLRSYCLKNEISLQDYLIAILTIYYKKAENVECFDLSLAIHNRNDRKERQTLGVFVKLIPCRIETGNYKLSELFKIIKVNQRQDYRHKSFPASHFNNMLRDASNSSKPYDICVNYRYFKLNTSENELDLKGFRNDATFSQTPIEFSWCDFAEKGNEDLFMEITFREDYFNSEEIEWLGKRILFIINQFYDSVDKDINSFDILPEQEKDQLLFEFNNTAVDYPKEKTIVELFNENVNLRSENTALVFEDRALSYRELDELSNQLGDYLRRDYGIGLEDLVGIKLERSEWMIVSILAILKAGGAYVPIDPSYPPDRITYIEQDTGCKISIGEKELSDFRSKVSQYSKEKIECATGPSNLAYVIYTSGSTGRPKGVMIEHRNVVRLLKTESPLFDFNSCDVWTMFHSYAFDFSVWEMYGALLFGAKLVIVPKTVAQDSKMFHELLEREAVTVLNQTPSAFYNLCKEDAQKSITGIQVRYVIFGGEALSPGRLDHWKHRYPVCQLINMYGITETTVHTTYKEISQEEITLNRSNIGRAIPTVSCLVLDENRNLVPIGVSGEMCVGGAGLARGYLNRAELTAERFIAHPFKQGERLYLSGDNVKLHASGDLEYMGRKDGQVKIRGYRIELGEIEHALLKKEGIEQVIVLVKQNKDQEKKLVAYLTSKQEENTSEIRNFLRAHLPEYMIPAHYVQLTSLPLTTNGKVDKKSLPDPERSELSSGVEYVAPGNETEEKLVKIWEDVLQRENIGVKDDFFAIGGHSLKMIKMINQINRQFDMKYDLRGIYVEPTIKSISQKIETDIWFRKSKAENDNGFTEVKI